jgi:hypothetical protein
MVYGDNRHHQLSTRQLCDNYVLFAIVVAIVFNSNCWFQVMRNYEKLRFCMDLWMACHECSS